MVIPLEHHARLAAVALRIHLTAGNRALTARKPVVFEKEIVAPVSLHQERVGIEVVLGRPNDS